jgi:hypothetical protein
VVLLLMDGATCNYPIGTVLRVTYAEREGIKEASKRRSCGSFLA